MELSLFLHTIWHSALYSFTFFPLFRFDSVSDLLEPVSDGLKNHCFISKSYDATSHFETAANDVLSIYVRITGDNKWHVFRKNRIDDLTEYVESKKKESRSEVNLHRNWRNVIGSRWKRRIKCLAKKRWGMEYNHNLILTLFI